MGLVNFLSRFKREEKRLPFQDEKVQALEKLLGPMAEEVGHPLNPFNLSDGSGELTRYYYPNVILDEAGTGFVTMELTPPDGKGPRNEDGNFELIAFTKQPFAGPAISTGEELADGDAEPHTGNIDYNRAEERIWFIFNTLTSMTIRDKVTLKPGDTLELRADSTGHPDAYIFLSRYGSRVKPFFTHKRVKCHLLLMMEVTAEEYEKAQKVGPVNMTNYLKASHRWPYSLEQSWSSIL